MSQNQTGWSASGFTKTDYGISPESTLANGLTANAPNYRQTGGLRDDLVNGVDITNMPYQDFSDIFETMDTTEHNFFDSMGYGSKPQAVEFTWKVEDISSLQVPIKTGGALKVLAAAGKFGNKASGHIGDDVETILLSTVIDTSTQIGGKIRSGHILRNKTTGGHEMLLVMDLTNPTTGTNALYILRGANIGGRLTADDTDGTYLPVAATAAHSVGDTLVVAGLVTSENNLAPQAFRSGYTERSGFIQVVDFATSTGFFETLFTNHAPAPFNDPVAHSKTIHDLQFFEVWNNIALYGVPARFTRDGYDFYGTAGVLHEIKKYNTLKWGGTGSGVGGYYPMSETAPAAGTFVTFACNGDSNFRRGTEADPTVARLFTMDLVNELNAKVIDKLGSNNKNRQYEPNTIWGSREYLRLFSQFDSDRIVRSTIRNETSGYYATTLITDSGNELTFKVDNTLGNSILIGSPGHAVKKPLVTMLRTTPPVLNRSQIDWFTSIMGMKFDYPEYAWGLHENLKSA